MTVSGTSAHRMLPLPPVGKLVNSPRSSSPSDGLSFESPAHDGVIQLFTDPITTRARPSELAAVLTLMIRTSLAGISTLGLRNHDPGLDWFEHFRTGCVLQGF